MTPTRTLHELGCAWFGPDWCLPLAGAAGVNPRTTRRIKAAALGGRECDQAFGVLAALADRLRAEAVACERVLEANR